MKWLASVVCIITGAEEFQTCSPIDDHWWFDIYCPPQYVIIIRSADVGFIQDWNDDASTVPCELIHPTCTLSNERSRRIFTECNERESCYPGAVPFNKTHCHPGRRGMKIARVTYECIKRKWKCLLFQYCVIFAWTSLIICSIATARHGRDLKIAGVCLSVCLWPLIQWQFLVDFDETLHRGLEPEN